MSRIAGSSESDGFQKLPARTGLEAIRTLPQEPKRAVVPTQSDGKSDQLGKKSFLDLSGWLAQRVQEVTSRSAVSSMVFDVRTQDSKTYWQSTFA